MASVIDPSLVTMFSSEIHRVAEQTQSRLRKYCKVKQVVGDDWAYDGIDSVDPTQVTDRNSNSTPAEVTHWRRKLSRERYETTLLVDASDIRGGLMRRVDEYSRLIVNGLNRQVDRTLTSKMFANVLTGRDMDTILTYANDGGATVDATSGLTYAKMLEIQRTFIDNEVGNEGMEDFVLGVTGDEWEDLMSEEKLTSSDYHAGSPVTNGGPRKLMDFDILKYGASVDNPILNEPSARECFAMSVGAMCLGISKDISLTIKDRPDKVETVQVQAVVEFGAVRTEGKRIIKVNTTV